MVGLVKTLDCFADSTSFSSSLTLGSSLPCPISSPKVMDSVSSSWDVTGNRGLMFYRLYITYNLAYPLTVGVVGAPQMTSQPVSSIFYVLHCPLGLGEFQACPFLDVVFPPLFLFVSSSSPFHCALQAGFGQT